MWPKKCSQCKKNRFFVKIRAFRHPILGNVFTKKPVCKKCIKFIQKSIDEYKIA